MKVVVVESPAKAKSIAKYLPEEYTVLASYGHVRDLPSKKGSVQPEQDFLFIWQTQDRSLQHLKLIVQSVKNAQEIILATDPDREGEAISWHVLEVLKQQDLLQQKIVKRVAFNAVTKTAVLAALSNPRSINQDLVNAYLTRLGLDYLVGFTLSPVLWRKLPGSRSAGRVQSVALRLIVEREQEIEAFIKQEYWTIEALFKSGESTIKSQMTYFRGQKLEKLSISTKNEAEQAVLSAQKETYRVFKIEKRRVQKNPQPPFITSTLQQESFRKLGLTAARTMTLAQRLYEGIDVGGETTGLITYMRTDSPQMVPEAMTQAREVIQAIFGQAYLPSTPRIYKAKAKNSQEAHEAIRPTDLGRHPDSLKSILPLDQWKVYELIWKRTIASQMANAQFDQTTVDIKSASHTVVWRATGRVVLFDGFLKLYRTSFEEENKEASESATEELPPLHEGQILNMDTITPLQHFTQPSPRYSEASLVKKMEELGIGRPSTYARILEVLQDRQYVRHEKRQLIPEIRGRMVTIFLVRFFQRYVEYDFTATMETELDEISAGERSWKEVLKRFWDHFVQTVQSSQDLKISDVLSVIEEKLTIALFPDAQEGKAPSCPQCQVGSLGLRLGRFGSFVGCTTYPNCTFTRPLQDPKDDLIPQESPSFPRPLGNDPQTGQSISVRLGPYGSYLQWGEGEKCKRVTLPKSLLPEKIKIEEAIELGALPREIGQHPETQLAILIGVGRFGFYVKYNDRFIALKKEDKPLELDLERALELINGAPPQRKKSKSPSLPRVAKKSTAIKRKASAKRPL